MGNNKNESRLADLSLFLNISREDYNINKSSLFHGALMEIINSDYAEEMHRDGLKPFSQYLSYEDDKLVWHIRTLSEKAYENIICLLNEDSFNEFEIKHDSRKVIILQKKLQERFLNDIFNDFYSDSASDVYKIEFVSPTAFKKEGKYHFFPEIYNIYNSLMHRFDEVTDRGNMFSQDTLELLTYNTEIVGYSIHSIKFSIEGVRIPAFMGSITIKIHGAQTMKNFAKLLFEFGNYSGMGIKTAIGMGSVIITEKRRGDNDRTGS